MVKSRLNDELIMNQHDLKLSKVPVRRNCRLPPWTSQAQGLRPSCRPHSSAVSAEAPYSPIHILHIVHFEYVLLNFTRSWGFGIFRVYWVSKSKCIISSNLRAEGSSGKVLNVVIFVESVVHRSNWRSRETETVGNSRERPGVIMPKLSVRHFFAKKKLSAQSHFFLKVQRETVGNSWGSYLWLGKKRAI